MNITFYDEPEHVPMIQSALQEWYLQHASERTAERIAFYTERMGAEPTKVVVKDQKLRWGTCTGSGSIYLNWRLFMAPMRVVDYVIVHEHTCDIPTILRSFGRM